jgi:hypothetical protein
MEASTFRTLWILPDVDKIRPQSHPWRPIAHIEMLPGYTENGLIIPFGTSFVPAPHFGRFPL